MAVSLHEEERFGVQRQANFGVIFHAMDGHAIQELQRAGNNLCGDDGRDGFGGLLHPGEGGHHGLLCGGPGNQAQ